MGHDKAWFVHMTDPSIPVLHFTASLRGGSRKKVGQKARKHLLTKRFMIEGQKKLGHKPAIKLHEVLNRSNYSNYCQLAQ